MFIIYFVLSSQDQTIHVSVLKRNSIIWIFFQLSKKLKSRIWVGLRADFISSQVLLYIIHYIWLFAEWFTFFYSGFPSNLCIKHIYSFIFNTHDEPYGTRDSSMFRGKIKNFRNIPRSSVSLDTCENRTGCPPKFPWIIPKFYSINQICFLFYITSNMISRSKTSNEWFF